METMNLVPLITSIPPQMRRMVGDHDVGMAYRRACIESWRAAGLQAVTVNSVRERAIRQSLSDHPELEIVEANRDAERDVGRPLIHFHDLLQAACRVREHGVVIITNADVMLRDAASVNELCRRVTPTSAVMARRIDVATPEATAGSPFFGGFDFFAVHTTQLGKIADIRLVFGAPWWDYYLPIALMAQGVRVVLTDASVASHLRHAERWDLPLWRNMGSRFLRGVRTLLDDSPAAAPALRAYADLFHRCVNKRDVAAFLQALRSPWRARGALLLSLGMGEPALLDILTRLSQLTVEFFDATLVEREFRAGN